MAALDLLFPGCEIDEISIVNQEMVIEAHTCRIASVCPQCKNGSMRVHSYYRRVPNDLPVGGYVVRLHLRTRRFRCLNTACPQQTFAERLPDFLDPHAQRTNRLIGSLYHIGQALSGAAGSRLSDYLRMPASGDTLLRILRKQSQMSQLSVGVLGIDDWAIRKGHTYGTILVDLERHQVVDLLPDRNAETVEKWLRDHPGIKVIARDRSTEYKRGITAGAPLALQVADRWHLLLNLRQMLERIVNQLYPGLEKLSEIEGIDHEPSLSEQRGRFPRSLTEEEAIAANRIRRQKRYEEIQHRRSAGQSIRHIANELGIHRATVRNYYFAQQFPERKKCKPLPSELDPFLPHLEKRRKEGCEIALQLWREIREMGYPGSPRQVTKWLQKKRKHPSPSTAKKYLKSQTGSSGSPATGEVEKETETTARLPTVKQLSWLLVRDPEELSEKETQTLQHINQERNIEHAYSLAQQFVNMVRQRSSDTLDPWLEGCHHSNIISIQNFAAGIKQDYAAVKAALETDWSNAQTEGQVNRLKMLKRQMYGRAGLDLLRIRILYPSRSTKLA